jgi:hypothetical protein
LSLCSPLALYYDQQDGHGIGEERLISQNLTLFALRNNAFIGHDYDRFKRDVVGKYGHE